MRIFLEKHYLFAMAGILGVLILSSVMKKHRENLLAQPFHQEETSTGTQAVVVQGSKADVPQKLIDELNNKRD